MESLKELRESAREILKSGKWLASVSYGERTVVIMNNGYECSNSERFDPEFVTQDINIAINYLYPEL